MQSEHQGERLLNDFLDELAHAESVSTSDLSILAAKEKAFRQYLRELRELEEKLDV